MMTTTNTTTKQRKRTQSSSILLSLRILVFIASSFSFCSADVQQLEENDDVLPVRSRQFKQSKWQKHDDALLLGRRRHPPLPTGLRRASGLRPVPIDEKGIDEEVNVLPLSETEKRQLEEASRNLAEQQCNKECGLVIPGTPGGLGRRIAHGEVILDYYLHPWAVKIAMDIKYSEESCTAQSTPSCSGVIVGAKTILTTAHCFFHRNPCLAIEENMPLPPKTFIDLSSVKVKTMPGHIDENSYDVEEITLLGGFQRPYQDIQYTALHDIAVVTLKEKMRFDQYVRPICLSTSIDWLETHTVGKLFRAVGFGKTAAPAKRGKNLEMPRVEHVEFALTTTCSASETIVANDPRPGQKPPRFFCGVGLSGGAMKVYKELKYTYVKVPSYCEEIEKTANQMGDPSVRCLSWTGQLANGVDTLKEKCSPRIWWDRTNMDGRRPPPLP